MRVGACGVEFDDTTQPSNTTGSASLPCISNDNSSQCSNTSDNCTAQDNGFERATVAVAALVGSSIAIISVTALVFIPIAVAAGVLKRKRHTLKQGRKKSEICNIESTCFQESNAIQFMIVVFITLKGSVFTHQVYTQM